MKKTKTRIVALLGAFALTAWGIGLAACSHDSGGSSGGWGEEDDGTGGGGGQGSSTNVPNIDIPSVSLGEGAYFPEKDAENAYADTILAIQFDGVPTIGNGTVTIYNGDTVVDTIKPTGEEYYSVNKNYQLFKVDDQLITVNGKTVIIKPHTTSSGYSILEPGTKYSVVVDDGLLNGKVGGAQFNGIAKGEWTFTVGAATTITGSTISVGPSGDFYTIQGAFNYIKQNSGSSDWTIKVAAGSYHELLAYQGSANVTIVGDDSEYGRGTVVYWRNSQGYVDNTQRTRQTFMWQGGNLVIKNMTFVNTEKRVKGGTDDVRGETLYFDCANDLVVYNSSFSAYQDTLLIGTKGGRAWFYKCYIEGDVDFIWGEADVALFEECNIVCRADGIKNQAHIFASRAPVTDKKIGKGFVLMNSDIEIEENCKVNYGRNSGSDTQATVLNNRLTGKGTLNATLWGSAAGTNASDVKGEPAVGYKDYNNTMNGTLVSTSGRLKDTWDLTERIAKREYNGRHVIFNRLFNTETGVYEMKESVWDISAFESEFNATADESAKNVFIEPVFVPYLIGADGADDKLKSCTFTASSFNNATFTYAVTDGADCVTISGETVTAVAGKEGDVTITVTSSSGATDYATTHVNKEAIAASKVSLDSVTDKAMVVGDVQWITAKLLAADGTGTVTDCRVKWTASEGILFYNDANGEAIETLEGSSTNTAETIGIYANKAGTVKITAESLAYPNATKAEITITVTEDGKTVGTIPADGYTFYFIGPDTKSKDSLLNGTKGPGPARDYNVGSTTTEKFSTTLGTGGKYITLLKDHNEPQLTDKYFKVKGNKHNTIDGSGWAYKNTAEQNTTTAMPTKDALLLKGVQGPFTVTVKEAQKCGSSRYLAIRLSDNTVKTFDAYADYDSTSGTHSVNYSGSDAVDVAISSSNDVYLECVSLSQYVPSDVEITAGDFAKSEVVLDLNGTKEETQTLTATVSDGSAAAISYSSSKPTVATVDSSTGKVTAVAIGRSVITATVKADGAEPVKKTYIVTVKNSATPSGTYTLDFKSIFEIATIENSIDLGVASLNAGSKNAYIFNGVQHGITFKEDNRVTLKVKAGSVITITQCRFDNPYTILVSTGGTAAVTDVTVDGTNGATVGAGVVSVPAGSEPDGKTTTITIPGGFTDTSVTLINNSTGQAYLHEISVEY